MQLDQYFALFKPHFLKYTRCHNWLEITNQDQLMLGKPTRVGEVVLKQSNSDLELQEKFKINFFLNPLGSLNKITPYGQTIF